jgi:hypothetical protein
VVTTHLVREKDVVMELRRGRLHVLLDNTDVGSSEVHDTIEPWHHAVQVKACRYTSARYPFDAAERESVNRRCNGAEYGSPSAASSNVCALDQLP